MGKKGNRKGYIKGPEHFRDVAAGKVQGSGRGYGAKVVAREKGERPALVESKPPLQDRFESVVKPSSVSKMPITQTPAEILLKTCTIMTNAYFYGAAQEIVTIDHFGYHNYQQPPQFLPLENKDLLSRPCRLVAKLIQPSFTNAHLWEISRVVGYAGNQIDKISLKAECSDIYGFLDNWEDRQIGLNKTNASLPRDLNGVLITQLRDWNFADLANDLAKRLWNGDFSLKNP